MEVGRDVSGITHKRVRPSQIFLTHSEVVNTGRRWWDEYYVGLLQCTESGQAHDIVVAEKR